MLRIVGAACMVALTVFVCLLLNAARVTVATVPKQLQVSSDRLTDEVHAIHADLNSQLDKTRDSLIPLADKQLGAIQRTADADIKQTLEIVDRRIGDSLARVDVALGTVEGIRKDLQPTLTATAALVKDTQDSLDDVYYDVKASVESATVASTSVAQTAQSINAAMPPFLSTLQKIGDNSDATTAKSVAMAEEGRKTLANLAANTTPLPKFIRYPAQAIGLIGSAALPVIGITKLVTAGTIPSTLVQIVGPKQ